MWSPFCRRVSFLSYRVSFGTLWKKDTQKTLVPAKSTCVNCELKLWLNEGRYLAKICTTMIVRPVSRGNKRYLRLLYVTTKLVWMNGPPEITAWSWIFMYNPVKALKCVVQTYLEIMSWFFFLKMGFGYSSFLDKKARVTKTHFKKKLSKKYIKISMNYIVFKLSLA